MTTDQLTVDRDDGRVTLTLDRPEKLNVLTTDIFEGIGEAVEACDPETTDVVTVRGAGGNFSAGVDMSNVPEWIEQTPLEVRDTLEAVHDTLRAIEGLDVP
ncbi:MAG: enoyl-CoA hydratase/isomerase family protein, partial [Haloarculaceae archaeon]